MLVFLGGDAVGFYTYVDDAFLELVLQAQAMLSSCNKGDCKDNKIKNDKDKHDNFTEPQQQQQ